MKTIIKNAKVFTGSANQADAFGSSCLVVNEGVIEYIGVDSHDAVAGAAAEGAQVVDLCNHTICPGFIDGHMHLLMYGNSLQKISIEHCRTLEDIRSTIREAAKTSTKPRILCSGWMHSMTDSKALASDLDDLDDKGRPIYIDSKDLHSTWVNTAALTEMGAHDMPNPTGGEIHRDASGKATGLLSEAAAVVVVWPHLANAATMDEKKQSIREAIKSYNMAGYTGMVEMATDENAWEALLKFRKEEPEAMTVRLAVHWLITPRTTDEENLKQVDRAIELHTQFNMENSPDFRIAGIKIIGDGVVDACTASLLEPYSNNGVHCDPLWEENMLKKVVEKADKAGMQCALHAIGDRTVKMAIDVLESVASKGKRHRIEHLEMTSPGDAKRLAENGITASVQAVHSDPSICRAWENLLGVERRKRAFAYREFMEEGANIALGTDAPTAANLPLENLYVATTRKSAREPDCTDTFNLNFALPMLYAFSAATHGAAYSSFMDEVTGKLEVGKKADFVVLDMEWTPEKLLQAKVLQTWFAGKKVFDVEGK